MTNRSHPVPFGETPAWTGRSHAEYVEGESLVEMVRQDLTARRISIEDCRDIIQHLRDQDAPTRHRLEGILALKGERAGDAVNRAARMATDVERITARTTSS